jgi:hypothetical protein
MNDKRLAAWNKLIVIRDRDSAEIKQDMVIRAETKKIS